MRLSNGRKHAVFDRFAGPTTDFTIKICREKKYLFQEDEIKQDKLQMIARNENIWFNRAGDRENAVRCCHSSFCNT